jgi:hypothetical protein
MCVMNNVTCIYDVLLCGLIDLRIILLNLVCMYVCVNCLLRSESYTTKVVNSYFHLYRCD